MNNNILIGRIATELELVKRGDSAVCNFNLAVDRKGNKDKSGNKVTDFIPCEIWGSRAESLVKNSGKGLLLGVRGEIHVSSFEDSETHKKRKNVTVYVSETDILEWNNSKREMSEVKDGDIPFPTEE